MSYEIKRVDVTTLTRATILHGVNCQGVMGSGIAGALARKWPQVRDDYMAYIRTAQHLRIFSKSPWDTRDFDETLLGRIQFVEVNPDIIVVNCFTQRYFGGDGRRYADPDAIATALFDAFSSMSKPSTDGILPPVYLPQIGCGLGGLSWESDVKPLYDEIAHSYPEIPFTVCTLD